jgi:hypothetical protein
MSDCVAIFPSSKVTYFLFTTGLKGYMNAHSSHNDVQPEISPLASAPVRLDLNPSDFQLGRELFRPTPTNLEAGVHLPSLSYLPHDVAHSQPHHAHHRNHNHHSYHHHQNESAHHAPVHHETQHHPSHSGGQHNEKHIVRHDQNRSLSPDQIAAISNSWDSKADGAHRPHDTLIPPTRSYGAESFAHPVSGSLAWTEKVLRETVASLEGKSPQVLERALDPRLGCARCVTQFGHRAYGLPITDSVANLEASMQARNFERVPMNAQTIAQMQPGDIVVGHRNGGAGGGGLHGHTAIYLGDNTIFSDNSLTGKMTTASLNSFREPLKDRNGHINQNGYSDVWIYRPRAAA